MRPLNFVVVSPRRYTRCFATFFRKNEMRSESHSRMLGHKDVIFALETHNVKPDANCDYLMNYEKLLKIIDTDVDKKPNLIGSWSVQVGDQDQYLHLWRYNNGFTNVDSVLESLEDHEEYKELHRLQGSFMRSRHLQYMFAFTFWPQIEFRHGKHMYEIRTYTLQPGTMIEWGNNWARAIQFRNKKNEAFAGFFSQVGRLSIVHHIWCFKNLDDRKEIREAAWNAPGWDQCVYYTVPLIQDMHCRIIKPNSFSPTK